MNASSLPTDRRVPLTGSALRPVAEWQRAVVYGLGNSGVAASRLLLERGISVMAVDDRAQLVLPSDLAGNHAFTLVGPEASSALDLQEVSAVVVSPGVPASRPVLENAVSAGLPVIAEVELAYQCLLATSLEPAQRLCGVTGSNGKSTVTQLVVELLRPESSIACGNFGVPLSDCVLQEVNSAAAQTLVVELSSFQLESTFCFRTRAAALLNISADHLDRHGSLDDYVKAKRRLFANQQGGDVAILNADDPLVAVTQLPAGVRAREFSLERPVLDGCYLEEDAVWLSEPGGATIEVFKRSDLAIVGDHNLANAMAAVLLAQPFNLDLEAVPMRLAAFAGLPHRTQLVAEADGVRWIDDSKGTNIGATLKSLEGFADGSVLLIAGGRAKGGHFKELREMVSRKVAHLYLVGEAAAELKRDLGNSVPTNIAGTVDAAVRLAKASAQPAQVVLLSPACASFDQFKSYTDRGEFFQREVLIALGSGGESDG